MIILMMIEVLFSLRVPAPNLLKTWLITYIVIKVIVDLTEMKSISMLYKKTPTIVIMLFVASEHKPHEN